jgi:hypothetical protein
MDKNLHEWRKRAFWRAGWRCYGQAKARKAVAQGAVARHGLEARYPAEAALEPRRLDEGGVTIKVIP